MIRHLHYCAFAALLALAPGSAGDTPQGNSQKNEVRRPPNNVVDRLRRMTPEERKRLLDKLPPERRRLLEERLRQYDSLTPEQRRRLRAQYDTFQQLPPAQQDAARRLFQRFGSLPANRRPAVRQEFQFLRNLQEANQRAHMNTETFRRRFNPQERQLLEELLHLEPAR
jgi:uncharacterized protein DUF3106